MSRALDPVLDDRPDNGEDLRAEEPAGRSVRLKLPIIGEAAVNLETEARER
jgi:uncharacterized protein with HEPN domain